MKTAKLVVGIISIVLFIVVMFQSCAAGLYDAMASTGGSSGFAGAFVGFCMLIAGIVGIATRKSKGGGIAAAVLYTVGGITGLTSFGVYTDLVIWSILCLVFAALFFIGSITMKKPEATNTSHTAI